MQVHILFYIPSKNRNDTPAFDIITVTITLWTTGGNVWSTKTFRRSILKPKWRPWRAPKLKRLLYKIYFLVGIKSISNNIGGWVLKSINSLCLRDIVLSSAPSRLQVHNNNLLRISWRLFYISLIQWPRYGSMNAKITPTTFASFLKQRFRNKNLFFCSRYKSVIISIGACFR